METPRHSSIEPDSSAHPICHNRTAASQSAFICHHRRSSYAHQIHHHPRHSYYLAAQAQQHSSVVDSAVAAIIPRAVVLNPVEHIGLAGLTVLSIFDIEGIVVIMQRHAEERRLEPDQLGTSAYLSGVTTSQINTIRSAHTDESTLVHHLLYSEGELLFLQDATAGL